MPEDRQDEQDLQRRISELERALLRERRRLSVERQEHDRSVAEAMARPTRRQLQQAKKEAARLERRLSDVYSSRTWRAGRFIWKVFHLPRLLRRRTAASNAEVEPAPSAVPDAVSAADPVSYSLVENAVVRGKYEAALAKTAFERTIAGRNVVMAVYTTDLDEGRGDLYTAIGLGRHLEMMGFEVVYLPQARWYDLPANTGIFLALLETADPRQIPGDVTTIAWVRNQTDVWSQVTYLTWYDQVLCSSSGSLEALEHVYPGPIGLLPIGVDPELFHSFGHIEDREGVATTVNQWGREREVFTSLEEGDIVFPLALFGEQRGASSSLARYARGPISFFALPSLYNEARVVLDDFNHTTAPYGNVNSRVYEAAACGAIVVTNRSLDPAVTGLEGVASYGSPAELHETIAAKLESHDAAKRAHENSRLTVEAHSYARRAEDFRRAIEDPGIRKHQRAVIGSYPTYTDNPYTEMMWSDLRNEGAVPMLLAEMADFEVFADTARGRPAVLHLNWTAPILGAADSDRSRRSRYVAFRAALDRLTEINVPSIWTVHNVLPHECADPRLEAQLRQEIADRVDIVHVMCESTAARCAGLYEIPESKIRIIPHPSYVDVYPNIVDKETARHELGLRYDDFVYLYFGQVRPYKGFDILLDAFDRVASGQPSATLLVAGKAGRFPEMAEIKQRVRAHPQIRGFLNPIPDTDVQLYMNAADVVVLPYREALNSGTLLLAYSFARPVISADVGCLAGQVDRSTGILFDPAGGSTSLLAAMQDARAMGRDHGAAAYARALELHYTDVSGRFRALVDELIAQRSIDTKR